ncbi:MAG: hypothetical protein V3G42_08735 [Oscillospiraceae bacterium]
MGFFGRKTTVQFDVPEIQVMMLGARRTGKTSMLASMYNSFTDATAGTNLMMSKKGGKAIDDSLEHMKALFKIPHLVNEPVAGVADFTQTQGFDRIDFQLTIAGKKAVKPKVVRFVDCSGEWINNRTKEEEIGEEIEKSEVVMIAVDTVLLMEENGKYNRLNAVQSVTEFIINNMNPDAMLNNKKMVLFVPMKCEKYFHQNATVGSTFYQKRMHDLANRIKQEYKQLLDFLTCENNQQYFTVGILPVITLGGIEFDEFTEEGNTDILTDAIQFRYCEPDKYEPLFCNRPLIYTLLFVQKKLYSDYYVKAYDANKKKKKLSASLLEWLQGMNNIPKETDYLEELDKVADKLKSQDYAGFEMIQDPEYLEKKLNLY